MEYNRARVVDFMMSNGYPVPWTEDMLSSALMIRAFDDSGTIAYFWGHYIEAGIMAFHVCVEKGHHAVCMSRKVIAELERMAFWVGADILLTSLDDIPNSSRVRLLLLRQGFIEEPDMFDKQFVYSKNLWNPDGKPFQETQDARHAGDPDASRTGED